MSLWGDFGIKFASYFHTSRIARFLAIYLLTLLISSRFIGRLLGILWHSAVLLHIWLCHQHSVALSMHTFQLLLLEWVTNTSISSPESVQVRELLNKYPYMELENNAKRALLQALLCLVLQLYVGYLFWRWCDDLCDRKPSESQGPVLSILLSPLPFVFMTTEPYWKLSSKWNFI